MKIKFIVLTEQSGEPIWINPDKIVCMREEGTGTEINAVEIPIIRVRESPEHIFEKIEHGL